MARWFLVDTRADYGNRYGAASLVTCVKADSQEDAIECSLREHFADDEPKHTGPHGRKLAGVEQACLYEVVGGVDLLPIMRDRQAAWQREQDAEAAAATEDAERAEYERLKAKFGGG